MKNQQPPLPPSQDAQIHQLQQELIQAQRMAALGELVSTTTHEFNNILMTILNYAKLGLRHKDDATRDKALNKILAAAGRAEKITSSVLGMARNRNEDFAPTELQPLIEQSLILLEREMQKYRIEVRREFAKVPSVLAIGNQIQQVLLNLMTNARQAMPSGGVLVLNLTLDEPQQMVDLTIRDSGGGIARDQLPRIFDRYFTTKTGPDATGKGGTGVGLSTCRDIVEAHHGRIRVESTVGKGTAFTIKLPVATVNEHPQTTAPVTQLGIPQK
jgi:signal transduction histidine kinase